MPDAKPGSQASAPSGRRLGYSLVGVFGASGLRRVLLSYLVFNAAETGTWVAILVWAFDTGGARAAGLIAVVQLVPAMLLAPFGAVIGDRMRRDRALALGYAIQAMTLLAAGTALAVDASTVTIFGLAALASTAIGLTRPVQHAILPEVANTPEELTAGNAASTSVEGLALLLGPLSAGTLLGLFGPGSVFLLFGTLSIGSVVLTYSLPIRRTFVRDDDPERLVKAAFRGLREVAHNSAALLLTFVVGAQFVVVGLLDILVVVLGIDVLHMGQSGPGILTAALGFGTIVGAIATMTFVARRRLSPAVLGGMLLTGLALDSRDIGGSTDLRGCAAGDVRTGTCFRRYLGPHPAASFSPLDGVGSRVRCPGDSVARRDGRRFSAGLSVGSRTRGDGCLRRHRSLSTRGWGARLDSDQTSRRAVRTSWTWATPPLGHSHVRGPAAKSTRRTLA